MATVIIYSDFDGTMTRRGGEKTVYSDFYQSLLTGYIKNKLQEYKSKPMLSAEDLQNALVNKFGAYDDTFEYDKKDADLLITPDAIAFFHKVLQHKDIKVHIVTKNRREYVMALLKYQGFTDEELNKLSISDSGEKLNYVKQDLASQIIQADKIFIFDDSLPDLNKMKIGTQKNNYEPHKVSAHTQQPGHFNWKNYEEEIELIAPFPKPAQALDVQPTNNIQNDETLYKVSLTAFIGALFGLLIGVALVVTGLFGPFGFTIVGAVMLASLLSISGTTIFGGISYVLNKFTDAAGERPADDLILSNSHDAMRGLGSKVTPNDIVIVEHFSNVLAGQQTSKEEHEPPLYGNML